tara:strand:- start:2946 stop:4130 length:1185 start_codon:yes stop_codon:yes gene_type:complete
MSYYKFDKDDLFINTIRSEPQYSFYIYSGSVYINNVPHQTQRKRDLSSETIQGVPKGYVSLYEWNIDRPSSERIYPFVYKGSRRESLKTINRQQYQTQYEIGDKITGSYNASASISRDYISSGASLGHKRKLHSLKSTLDHYGWMSEHFEFSSSFGDKSKQNIALISIPSVFYGSSIKSGTTKLKFFVTGTLVGQLEDFRNNGELVQTLPTGSSGSGSIAGVALYKEGFILLTGSWDLNSISAQYDTSNPARWVHWGYSGNDGNSTNSTAVSSSYLLEYSGTVDTQCLTMLAHAPYGELNHSNNPTFVSSSTLNVNNIKTAITGFHQYIENPLIIKNVVTVPYTDAEPPFEKTVYISKIGIYDKEKNLIGFAKLSKPIRKTEDIDYTFKIKLDI